MLDLKSLVMILFSLENIVKASDLPCSLARGRCPGRQLSLPVPQGSEPNPTSHALIIYFTYGDNLKNKESKDSLPHLRDGTTARELVDRDCSPLSIWFVPLSLNSTTPHGIH